MDKLITYSIFIGMTLICAGVAYYWNLGAGLMCYGSFWLFVGVLGIAYALDQRKKSGHTK